MPTIYSLSNSSAAVRYRWDSDELEELGDGAVTMDKASDIEDIMVIPGVRRDNRSKCVAGVGETIEGDGGVGGSGGTTRVSPLGPVMTSCMTGFKGAEAPAFRKEITWLAIGLRPEGLRQPPRRQGGTLVQIPTRTHFEEEVVSEPPSSFNLELS